MADRVDRLIKRLKHQSHWVRYDAADDLGKMGEARAVEPLSQALRDRDWYVRWRAARALGKIGDSRAVSPLIQALEDNDAEVRGSAAEALGQIGDAKAVEPLIKASNDENEHIREAATDALEEIQKQLAMAKQKHASILCSACFCRFTKHRAELGSRQSFFYYACSNCHGCSSIGNATRVVAVFDRSLSQPYVHRETTLLVNWFAYRQPFDFDEIRIEDAGDFDIDELVMKARNDIDDQRREGYKSVPVYLSPEVKLSQAKMNMLRDTFGRVDTTR